MNRICFTSSAHGFTNIMMLSMPCKEKARDTMPLKFCAPGFHSNATEVQATPPGEVQPCQNRGESSGRSHHVVPVGAYARAHWPVRGRCKLRQRPARRCPWPCNWWGWLCVGRVLTTGTQAPCGISACTMQRCVDSQQTSGLCSYFHSYRYWVWKVHFAVAMT